MRNVICIMLVSALLSAPLSASAQTPTNLLGSAPTVAVADAPVTLADATSFEAQLASEIADGEIADARRELANAVSAEKFLDGTTAVLAGALLLAIVF